MEEIIIAAKYPIKPNFNTDKKTIFNIIKYKVYNIESIANNLVLSIDFKYTDNAFLIIYTMVIRTKHNFHSAIARYSQIKGYNKHVIPEPTLNIKIVFFKTSPESFFLSRANLNVAS